MDGTPDGAAGGDSPAARRRRRRHAAAEKAAKKAVPPAEAKPAAPDGTAAPAKSAAARRSARKGGAGRDSADRGLKDLVGAGTSQVGISGALRARDLNRPTAEDLAEADREVVLVRRHWTPPAG